MNVLNGFLAIGTKPAFKKRKTGAPVKESVSQSKVYLDTTPILGKSVMEVIKGKPRVPPKNEWEPSKKVIDAVMACLSFEAETELKRVVRISGYSRTTVEKAMKALVSNNTITSSKDGYHGEPMLKLIQH